MWSYMQSHMILSQRLLDAIRCDNLSFPLPWLRMLYCLGIIPAEEGGLRYVKECSGSVNRGFLLNRRRAKKKIRAYALVSWEKKRWFPVGLKLSVESLQVQGTATASMSWSFSFSLLWGSPVSPWLVVSVVLVLLTKTDPAADHIFVQTLLFYQLYNLYGQKSEKKRKILSPFKIK